MFNLVLEYDLRAPAIKEYFRPGLQLGRLDMFCDQYLFYFLGLS